MTDLSLKMLLLGEDKTASAALRKVGDQAERTGSTIESNTGRLAGLGGFVAKSMSVGALGLVGFGAAALSMGVKTAAANEQGEISFTSLLGSASKAKSFLGDLTSFAAATPFDLPGVEHAAQQLLGVGVQSKQVIPFLTAFGNTASALGLQTDQFNSIMTQTTQAMAQGKFQIGDLNQLASNGVPIYKLLGEAFHTSQAHIIEMANAGQLTSDKVLPALQRQMNKDYGGAMDKQSRSLTGLWSTLQDTLAQALAKGVLPLVPVLGRVLPGAISAIGPVIGGLGTWLAFLVTWLSVHLPPALAFARRMFDDIRPTLALLMADFQSRVLPVLQQVVGWIVAHIPDVVTAFRVAWANIKPVVLALGGLLTTLWLSVLSPIVAWIVAHWPQIEVAMKVVFIAIAIAAKVLLVALQVTFTALAIAIRVLAAVIGWLARDVVTPVFRLLAATVKADLAIVMAVIHTAASVVRTLGDAFGAAYSTASAWIGRIVSVVSGLPGKIAGLAGAMVHAGANLIGGLLTGLREFSGGVGDVAGSIWNGIKGFINDRFIYPIRGFGLSILGHGLHPFSGLPALAAGGNIEAAGRVIVGDAGPEVLDLPRGARVTPLARAAATAGTSTINYVTIEVRPTFGTNAQDAAREIATALERVSHNGRPLNLRLMPG